MQYLSTRGGVAPVTFSQAVMMGLGTDGGLLLPAEIPQVGPATLRQWATLPFAELAEEVLDLYTGNDLPRDHLRRLIQRSYAGFDHPEVTPLVPVGDFHILELFHGPTLAFKDVALQFLGNLFEYLLQRDGGQLNILGATSGDTGSAAIQGVRGKARIQIFILHPRGRVSPIQERQMTTVLDPNVHNVAVQGTFDDGQRIVKELFNDLAFRERHHLGAVNSINWARIVAQVVYYFYAWGRLTGGDVGRPVVFSVPTGNFGDIFAGYVAQRMGLPVARLVLATNRNDILARFVASGDYQTSVVRPTISPSMDIQVSSNFERYLYYLLDHDPVQVQEAMAAFQNTGGLTVTPAQLEQVRRDFASRAVSEEETSQCIRRVYQEQGYLLDPHTAVGVAAAQGLGLEKGTICLATAHPAKFGEAVEAAIGQPPSLPPAFQDLLERTTRCALLPATAPAVRQFMEQTLAPPLAP